MNEKDEKLAFQEALPYIAAIIIVIAAVITLGMFLWRSRDKVVTEKVVQEYLQDYYGELTQEIEILSKNMSEELDHSLTEMGTRELTEDELQQLLDIVNRELSQATYNISQDEINRIANQIVKKVLEINPEIDSGLLEQYKAQLDELTGRVASLEKKISLIKSYTETDIKNIAGSLDLTEDQVVGLIKKYSTVTSSSLDALAKELGISVDELKKLIAESREYTDSFYIKLSKQLNISASDLKKLTKQVDGNTEAIDELAKRLGTTSEALYSAISESSELTESEINRLAKLLDKNADELSKMIEQNKELTETGLEGLSKELNVAKSDIYEQFNSLALSVDNINIAIEELVELSDDELRALAEEMHMEDDELRALINALDNELTDNYAELSSTVITRDALAAAQESIMRSLAAEADDREKAVNKAIDDLNAAISLSSGENAQKLQEAKAALQDAVNSEIGDVESALNNVNAQISSYLSSLDVEIDKLNSVITKVNGSINDIIVKVLQNSDDITSLGDQVSNNYAELKNTTATKAALEQAQSSIQEGLNTETQEREAAISGLGSTKAEIHYSDEDGIPMLIIDNVIRD